MDPELAEAKARSHPVRISLLDLLKTGPHTSTQAASKIGTNTGTTSFHLRQLERFGLVTPVTGNEGRGKPWQLSPADSVDGGMAAALDRKDDERYAEWRDREGQYPQQWQGQSASSYRLYLTAAERHELGLKLLDLISPFFEREQDPAARPLDAEPVALVTRLFPLFTPAPASEPPAARPRASS